MEPRPPSRRDTPTIAAPPPVAAPNGSGTVPDGTYQPAAPFDPYTAPEAQAAYGPTAGYPGDSATRLGPLADEPVFYPNPSLPPNRPAYQPAARYDARSEYALHPVGRVPPDHQPLNLRPAPPPVPPTLAPPNHNNLIKGILAGVIGLIAVIALVAAFLTFANGGFGGNDDPPPTDAAQLAGQPSGAVAAGVASPSADASTAPSGSAAAGAPVVPPPAGSADAGPATSDAAPASDAGSDAASDPASGDSSEASATGSAGGEASGEPSAGRSARASASAQAAGSSGDAARTTSSGDTAAFLPPPDDLPAGFDVASEEGDRSLNEVAQTFVAEGEDTAQAESDLEGWGWQDNQFVIYDAAPQPANEDINRYGVSVHQFESDQGASDAFPAFVDAFGVEPADLPEDTPEIGDDLVAMQTTNEDGNLAVLYVRSGAFILKIDAASITGDPLPAALELAQQLVG